jgi:hypothetical protein
MYPRSLRMTRDCVAPRDHASRLLHAILAGNDVFAAVLEQPERLTLSDFAQNIAIFLHAALV